VNRALVVLPFSLLLMVGSAFSATEAAHLKAGVFSPPAPAPEFTLRGSDGSALSLARYRGKLVLLAFGFTNCAEVCPVTLATLALARKGLGASAADVQLVYVTVDPERDTPERMKTHLLNFDPSFIGATGTPEVLAGVRKTYGVIANRVASAGGYAVDHSSSVYLIDREGKLRAMMPYGHAAADYVHDLQVLLKK
jgi:protein SCO1/2